MIIANDKLFLNILAITTKNTSNSALCLVAPCKQVCQMVDCANPNAVNLCPDQCPGMHHIFFESITLHCYILYIVENL